MSGSAGVVAFIVTIFVMIVVHEFGHFVAAKKFGMKVEEFFVGFGPRLWSWRRGETEYGIKGILLGGYVKIAGMNPWQTVPESEVPRTYGAKPAWQRAILLLAGSATHVVLSILLLFSIFLAVGLPSTAPLVGEVHESALGEPAPAKVAGFERGDRVLAVDGEEVSTWREFVLAVRSRPGESTQVRVERGGEEILLTVTPAVLPAEEEAQPIGFVGLTVANEKMPPHTALWIASQATGEIAVRTVMVIPRIFSPQGLGRIFGALTDSGPRSLEDPVGPVGAGRFAGQAAAGGGIQELAFVLASFVVIVGIINLLPLPPLDGGHLLVLAIEKVRRRTIDMKKVVPVAMVVLAFFLTLFMALLYLDIVRPVDNPFQ